jgi:hypothetical protein
MPYILYNITKMHDLFNLTDSQLESLHDISIYAYTLSVLTCSCSLSRLWHPHISALIQNDLDLDLWHTSDPGQSFIL